MTRTSPKSARRVPHPDEVREILEGVGRARPVPQAGSAMPAPEPTSTSSPTTPSDLDELTADLLRDVAHSDRPALVAHARLIARSLLWLRDFDNVMAAAIRNGEGDYLAILERLSRLKERESSIYARNLLVWQMMRSHELDANAQIVSPRSRPRRRRR